MNAIDKDTRSLLERIERQPGLQEKIEKLVWIMEAASGTPDDANDIEELIIQEGRALEKQVLEDWANNKHQLISATANRNAVLRRSGKKK